MPVCGSNVLVFYGIVKNIGIIGEAAYNLTNAFRNSHKETPWKSVMSMRNILVQPTCHLLAGAPEEVLDMPWSGNQPGTAGPGGIDPYSTIEVF